MVEKSTDQILKERWALGSLVLNSTLTVLKFVFAIITGSLALMAEAIHSFSDLIASVISLISVKLAAKKTKEYPYGLYKIENIASIIISFFLFFAAYEIIREAFFSEEERVVQHTELAILIMFLAMVATFVYSRLELKAAKKLNSPALMADAQHIWADFLSSMIVIVGLVGTYFGYNLDKYAASVVALFVFYSGWEIFSSGLKVLLDVSLEKDEIEKIKKIIYSHPAVVDIRHIRGRVAGSFKFLDIELLLHNYSLRETHRIVDDIERRIKEEIPNIDSVFIHYEPVRQEGLRIAFLTDEEKKIKDFKNATKVITVDISEEGDTQINAPLEVEPDEKEIGEILSKINIDIVVASHHPEEFEVRWNLARAGVMVWETDKQTFDEALGEIINSYKEFKKRKGEL
ncbi:cation diffusion facilitator family transporter [Persephonella hydrogeniphila]|uniref:Cation diffusion facilitator family transporter n=1 Tax=Persephonella hydrogeniphila TaxID=198703 RepID=A0A285NIE9_9AQUI|nr:cation diffusion facilitator family transporter [Persephonella hydrogeniphila]SNZ08683.1 cation diffusion facilitator family transporter [Persephonella hydrogeniphila]